ncbi:hypothetical protein [Candidatus Poriferisodalis sp.]|uniref:hypothetical protein n=1 Tax=Candidatus Poriferisodalis sp. TaxID=3101277 RepID=UPI003B5AFF23
MNEIPDSWGDRTRDTGFFEIELFDASIDDDHAVPRMNRIRGSPRRCRFIAEGTGLSQIGVEAPQRGAIRDQEIQGLIDD